MHSVHAQSFKTKATYLKVENLQWNSTFFTFSFIIEGTSKKVLQFLVPQQQIFKKKIVLINKNVYYEHFQKGSHN